MIDNEQNQKAQEERIRAWKLMKIKDSWGMGPARTAAEERCMKTRDTIQAAIDNLPGENPHDYYLQANLTPEGVQRIDTRLYSSGFLPEELHITSIRVQRYLERFLLEDYGEWINKKDYVLATVDLMCDDTPFFFFAYLTRRASMDGLVLHDRHRYDAGFESIEEQRDELESRLLEGKQKGEHVPSLLKLFGLIADEITLGHAERNY